MDFTVEQMMNDGFTIKMANFYHELMAKEWECGLWDDDFIEWAHSNGFLAESASAYNLSEDNMSDYISDYNYRKIWPLNSWERIWINDKLTLKYMMAHTEFDKYMPRYFYYVDAKRGLLSLIDNKQKENTMDAFFECLNNEKVFACKPCNGAGSQGFYKLAFENNEYSINGKVVSKEDIVDFVFSHKNFVFTEYLYPSEQMKKYSPIIHTLRVVVANDSGNDPFIVGGYLRFANETTGAANHMTGTTSEEFDLDTEVDWKTGRFYNPKAVSLTGVKYLSAHPDNGMVIDDTIDCWDEIKSFVEEFPKTYCLCEYLGFDLCVSNQGIKLMEINSHPGIKHMQIVKPMMLKKETKEFFEKKIEMMSNLSSAEIKARHRTWR